jgi:hypothetical protein
MNILELDFKMAGSTYSSTAVPGGSKQAENGLKPPLDLSHHFSRVTKARKESSIKEFYKYFAIPGIGNLAGGRLKSHRF